MKKESRSKSIKKIFSKSFLNVFGRLSLSSQKEEQFICSENQPEEPAPSITDLLDFEYLYSSLKSVNEAQVKKCIESIKIMTQEPINLQKLLQMVYFGIDDEMYALRPISWRLLVGYLPPTRKQWINILEKNWESYKQLSEEYIHSKEKVSKKQNDHPLNRSKESCWNNHFEDQKLWNQIEKDTKRTRQKEQFFKMEIEDENKNILWKKGKQYQYDILSRILFIYAKLNNNFYAQGMNEIAGLMYRIDILQDRYTISNIIAKCIPLQYFKQLLLLFKG